MGPRLIASASLHWDRVQLGSIPVQLKHRQILKSAMEKQGFTNYPIGAVAFRFEGRAL